MIRNPSGKMESQARDTNGTLFVVVLGTLMVAIDTTVVILALPTLVEELNTDLSYAIWTLLSYILATAVLSTQLGRVGDIFGRKKIYNLGFALFTVGSGLCGLSNNIIQLIVFRTIQALGGAMMISNSGAIIADNFPKNNRGKAFGYTSLGWNSGATIGIILGGVVTTFLGWRYIFFINVPIGVVAVLLGYFWIKPSPKVESKIDWPGLIIFSFVLVTLSLGSYTILGTGISALSLILILSSLLGVIPFVIVERRSDNPMIDFSAFKERILAYSLFSSFLQSVGFLSISFLITIYLQGIRDIDPFNASLLLVPGYVISSTIAPFAGRLSDKFGSRLLATSGLVLMLLSVLIYSFIDINTPLWVIIVASVITGVGSAMFYPANNSAIMANTPQQYYGSISGLARTLGNVGTLVSFVISISISSISVPKEVAFQVFIGTSQALGGLAPGFLQGIRSALGISLMFLILGIIFSSLRGKEIRI